MTYLKVEVAVVLQTYNIYTLSVWKLSEKYFVKHFLFIQILLNKIKLILKCHLSTRVCLIMNQTHFRGNQIWQVWLTTMHVTDNLSRLRLSIT